SIGSDSQGRVTAANNQRQIAGENKKPYNYLPLHVNTNKSKELLHPSASAPTTPAITKEMKKQSPGRRETLGSEVPHQESPRMSRSGTERGLLMQREYGRQEARIDSSQVMFCGYGRLYDAETRLYVGQFINMPPMMPSEFCAQPPSCPCVSQSALYLQMLTKHFFCFFFLYLITTPPTPTKLSPPLPGFVRPQVVSILVQIRDYISKASAMRDDLVEKNDVPANVERLSYLIDHLKDQEKSYLRFLQKVLVSLFIFFMLSVGFETLRDLAK
ncbi:hypothetical protein GOODEAATRI_001057, partial [Goodea atripinnis]